MYELVYFGHLAHYYHPNIIIYTKRPWLKDGDIVTDANGKQVWIGKQQGRVRAREMTEDLIKWHNELVRPEDTVWHLGDFTFGGVDEVVDSLRKLKGNFKFIWGNHEKALKDFSALIDSYPDLAPRVEFLGDMAEINIDGQLIVLCHYAMRIWRKSHHSSWHLFGHSHNSLPDDPNSMSFDVGVDCHNYRPIPFSKVKEIMRKKVWRPVDHHGADSCKSSTKRHK